MRALPGFVHTQRDTLPLSVAHLSPHNEWTSTNAAATDPLAIGSKVARGRVGRPHASCRGLYPLRSSLLIAPLDTHLNLPFLPFRPLIASSTIVLCLRQRRDSLSYPYL